MTTQSKLSIADVLTEGFSLGMKNALSVIGAIILWILTIWIPYLNVGTTIAIMSMPIALSRGKVISPTFIFEGKYRRYMGEYFNLIGLMLLSILPAMLFLYVPAIVIAISWSLSIYILLDKGVSPSDAMVLSNKATYGHKWTIFFISFILIIALFLLSLIFSFLGTFGSILILLLFIVYQVMTLGCSASIYKKLVLDVNLDEISTEEAKAPLFD